MSELKLKRKPERKETLTEMSRGAEFRHIQPKKFDAKKVQTLMNGINSLIDGIDRNYKELNKYYSQLYELIIPEKYEIGGLAVCKVKIGKNIVIKELKLEVIDGLLWGIEPVSLRKYPVMSPKGDYSDSFYEFVE